MTEADPPVPLDASARRLTYRSPLAAGRLLTFLAARAIPGIEHVTDTCYARAISVAGGTPVVIELTPDPAASVLSVRAAGSGSGDARLADVEEAGRRLFDLDADPAVIDASLADDPVLRPSVHAAAGTRVPGTIDGFELAVRAIVGQQVSVAGARTTLGRIAERYGEALPTQAGAITRTFPTAEVLADAPRDGLGMPGARADAIRALSAAVAAGELDLSGSAELGATRAALRAIPGVGPWTVEYAAMRALRDTDAFPQSDLGVRHAFAALGLPHDARSIGKRADRWRPWRAYAAMHLWHLLGPGSEVPVATPTTWP